MYVCMYVCVCKGVTGFQKHVCITPVLHGIALVSKVSSACSATVVLSQHHMANIPTQAMKHDENQVYKSRVVSFIFITRMLSVIQARLQAGRI